MLQDESALDWLHMMVLISNECASCTLPYGLKPVYIMETVPSVQFRSWSLDIHKMWKLMTRMVFRRCTNLGDTRLSIGDEMCQEFSSNVREASIYPLIQQLSQCTDVSQRACG